MQIALTGRPGIGKTTACLKIFEKLKDEMKISGFVTKEVREKGRRIGFKLVNLESGEESWLAKVGEGKVKVGKYAVFVENLEKFLDEISLDSDLIIIDEVGPMELKSEKFVKFVENLLRKDNVIFTIHYKACHRILDEIRRRFKVITLTEENRNKAVEEVVEIVRGRKSQDSN
ncbi:protein of unknown function DUF265 [Ferroglobus placidus DSM 10642]|uniref:Nucleoside-triphosphatase Ferp_1308 n=1 Tax=Ferroglobus placidus (strain DSM 10642 / AEDII12DO) TaxID=589924 RepID=D3RY99_FERPA|nr:NTPase [Ferroglobus placidus]ADC65462.1 protein of unknown function DUF265 [Ferroglobus placidus DSM 10642]